MKTLEPVQRRELVDHVQPAWDRATRSVCDRLLVRGSTYHCQSKCAGEAALQKRIDAICETLIRRRFRRVWVFVCKQGCKIAQNRVHQLYRKFGMQQCNQSLKRRGKEKLDSDRFVAADSQEIWALDFMHDRAATGSKLPTLTGECLISLLSSDWSEVQPSR